MGGGKKKIFYLRLIFFFLNGNWFGAFVKKKGNRFIKVLRVGIKKKRLGKPFILVESK